MDNCFFILSSFLYNESQCLIIELGSYAIFCPKREKKKVRELKEIGESGFLNKQVLSAAWAEELDSELLARTKSSEGLQPLSHFYPKAKGKKNSPNPLKSQLQEISIRHRISTLLMRRSRHVRESIKD
jgi:hypothetical protein